MADAEPSTKRCSKCSEVKPIAEFGRQKCRKDGLNPWCRRCRSIAAAEYHSRPEIVARRKEQAAALYQENREAILARNSTWSRANPGKRAEISRRWARENPDKVRAIQAKCDARRAPQKREWVRNQWRLKPDQYRGYSAARRAKEAAAKGSHTVADIRRIYEAQRGKCAYCRIKLNSSYHRDHIVALSKGGSNEASNIQLLCASCNTKKKDKDPIVFARQTGRLL